MNTGVYCIRNIFNDKMYIGSSVDIKKRIKRHTTTLNNGSHHSIILQRAWDKYGPESFEFVILKITENTTYEEQLYIDFIKPDYNVSKSSTAPMLGRKHSKETKKKFSSIKRPKGKGHYMYGKTRPKESIRKQIETMTGSKRSEKTKIKMSETAKRINAISRIDYSKIRKPIMDNLGNKFASLTDASLFHKINVATVCDILKGRHSKTRKGVSFEYI